MAEYNFSEIETKWQKYWSENDTYKVSIDSNKEKYYVLDMFPYPSGAGLHVGHPLGYIASDIVARYKRHKGFNVLHPMGFDSFGLPAEQYAVQTGQHPAITTRDNIARYKDQLGKIGFSYDWNHEIRTSDPSYYKWTQWIFIQLFHSWYNNKTDKAESIESLIEHFALNGSTDISAARDEDTIDIEAQTWNNWSEEEQQKYLLHYRLTYLSETAVNWCPALGTVLANDEVKDGVSERGGHPVERKEMKQWSMRITAYADRLLQGLDDVNWSESLKEMQRNWIGKSKGCALFFPLENSDIKLEVFTTRVDTTFGVTFMSIAPEHELVDQLTTPEQKEAVAEYVEYASNRSERDRMSDVKTISGVFTGSYATNPMNGNRVPIWIADYVLAGYGTGVVMAVPASDTRDYALAQHFDIPVIPVQEGPKTDISQDDFDAKSGTMINSEFLNGLSVPEAIDKAIEHVETNGLGKAKINFRLRDAVFSRQRYWGEPIPVYFKGDTPYTIEEKDLPLELPEIDDYKPTETGEPPLGRAKDWTYGSENYPLEMSTMPGWAGSSWYFLRYMDPSNEESLSSIDVQNYWKDVDLYLGGAEHATGHLLYSRFWNKFLFDRGWASDDEVFKKLVNQGMIQGRSSLVYRVNGTNKFVSKGLKKDYDVTPLHVDVNIVENDILDQQAFTKWRPDFNDASFELEDGKYICGHEVEKMSKRWYNVVNPDDIVAKYGADTLRMYEMFLGPLEQSKPWNTNGIDGVYKFLRKLWSLFHDKEGKLNISQEDGTKENYRSLYTCIKKIDGDINKLSLNTCISSFMICVNELTSQKCNSKPVLEKLTVAIAPFAPHIAEELHSLLGSHTSVSSASFPAWDEKYLQDDSFEYPIMINGKMRTKIEFGLDMSPKDIESQVLVDETVVKWMEGKPVKKIIVVPKRIVNVVM